MTLKAMAKVAVAIAEEVRLTVGDVEYVLTPDGTLFLNLHGHDNGEASAPILFMVYTTEPGQIISREALRNFRANVLDRDDIFQNAFGTHVVFYGSSEQDIQIASDASEELPEWNTKKWSFVQGDPSHQASPGP
jgi:hypothetical protein